LNLQVEWTPCDLCGAEDWEVLSIGSDRRHKLPGEFGVTKCRSCGHLQTNPRPTNEFLPTFYPESYSAHSAECHRIRHTKRDLHLMNLGRKFPFVGKNVFNGCGMAFPPSCPQVAGNRKWAFSRGRLRNWVALCARLGDGLASRRA